jgi:tRNA dimethylallyltransferase
MPPRAALYARCDARFAAMIERGALDEVAALIALGLAPDVPAMKALGVPELARHLAGEADLETAIAAAQQATRRYAKRQLTWFRHQIVAEQVLEALYPDDSGTDTLAEIGRFLVDRLPASD